MTRILTILLFLPLLSNAQTVLPNWLIDSMAFEVRKGRACESVMIAQENELKAQGRELLQTSKALNLSQKEIEIWKGLLENERNERKLDRVQGEIDNGELRKKIKKRNKVILIEGLAILGLVLLL